MRLGLKMPSLVIIFWSFSSLRVPKTYHAVCMVSSCSLSLLCLVSLSDFKPSISLPILFTVVPRSAISESLAANSACRMATFELCSSRAFVKRAMLRSNSSDLIELFLSFVFKRASSSLFVSNISFRYNKSSFILVRVSSVNSPLSG